LIGGASDAGCNATSPGITTIDTPRLTRASRIATSSTARHLVGLAQAQRHYTGRAKRSMIWLSAPRKGADTPAADRKGDQRPRRKGRCLHLRCVGLPTVWAARYLAKNGSRHLISSFWHGSMANALAQGVGAQAAFPGRQVISLSGDGGFQMSLDFLNRPAQIITALSDAVALLCEPLSRAAWTSTAAARIGVIGRVHRP
jgi:hypothetical protein